ncbi:pyridoxamine 5'-phosphate oxidase family protein [Kitasatospora sp. NBC_01539]|uniref:pyridoxamine 5'-phosphate oxidase family protein n=1 Tax=Kitasatospora sp. NBC_01539 TaxID=2903577 RepID=UPI00386026B5
MWHAGERAVQARTGQQERADHTGRSIGRTVPPVAAEFLTARRTLVVGAADAEGRLWATQLAGPAGFVRAADPHTLAVAARPAPGDPLAGVLAGPAEVGTIALDAAGRRRMRVNGRSVPDGPGGLRITADQVYANCPKYIQRRTPADAPADAPTAAPSATSADRLTLRQQLAVANADTFFVATAGPDGRVDASHRGGFPGFVEATAPDRLRWPEYPGNSMFMTLGNLELSPATGLLFPDWETGGALLVSGRAVVDWSDPAAPVVACTVLRVVELAHATALTWTDPEYSPANPAPGRRGTPAAAPPGA